MKRREIFSFYEICCRRTVILAIIGLSSVFTAVRTFNGGNSKKRFLRNKKEYFLRKGLGFGFRKGREALREKENMDTALKSMKKRQLPGRSLNRGRDRKKKGGCHMICINMLSQAGLTKGHGVLSAFEEQTKLVSDLNFRFLLLHLW